jgi:hypothetical protein
MRVRIVIFLVAIHPEIECIVALYHSESQTFDVRQNRVNRVRNHSRNQFTKHGGKVRPIAFSSKVLIKSNHKEAQKYNILRTADILSHWGSPAAAPPEPPESSQPFPTFFYLLHSLPSTPPFSLQKCMLELCGGTSVRLHGGRMSMLPLREDL